MNTPAPVPAESSSTQNPNNTETAAAFLRDDWAWIDHTTRPAT